MSQLAASPAAAEPRPDGRPGLGAELVQNLDEAAARGTRFRQDFPPDCVPIRQGRAVLPLDAYVSDLD